MCGFCDSRPSVFRVPRAWKISELKAVIPARLFIRETRTAILHLSRDFFVILALSVAAYRCDDFLQRQSPSPSVTVLKCILWLVYFWFQSLSLTAIWLIAHECGHESFSPSVKICDSVGFVIHSLLGTPYYSWKYTHRLHHKYNMHIEKDEHWIPERKHHDEHHIASLVDAAEDTPVFQLLMLCAQQIVGFYMYLIFNVSGQAKYSGGTSHFNPYSAFFRPKERRAIFLSDVGILAGIGILNIFAQSVGTRRFVLLYGIPWILLSHWILMIVYLQHIDPTIPHYDASHWTFSRGSLATMDRNFLGWQGRFFLHNVAHCHIVHHFFPKLPFYNLPEATEHVKKLLGPDYNYCESNAFSALYKNYLACQYVENNGILCYRDRNGRGRISAPSQTASIDSD